MKNVLSNEKRAAELYRVSFRCSELQGNCNRICGNCPLNVSLYMEDPREAVLLKTSASIDYNRIQQAKLRSNIPGLIVMGLIALLAIKCSMPKKPAVQVTTSVAPGNPAPVYRTRRYAVPSLLVADLPRLVTDVNNDGELNCIDYAVTFYKHWPGARIIRNINNGTGMDHLLNLIVYNDREIFIEPQGTPSKYAPEEVWGNKYDRWFNMDQTDIWAIYAK
ncbi:hypothetical protein AGMMS49928_14540 [Spirochaetia bacterium]|nr:hypothetical protein AGMMS49928_14540 [Spirochaetia bacterium]